MSYDAFTDRSGTKRPGHYFSIAAFFQMACFLALLLFLMSKHIIFTHVS